MDSSRVRILCIGLGILSICRVPAAEGPKHATNTPHLKTVQVGTPVRRSNVPHPFAQDSFLPPQSVSAVEVTADQKLIAVTTLAFRHDRNFWILSKEGKRQAGRYVLPWAPFQVAGLSKRKTFGVGLAYSRVTSPHPTISVFQDIEPEETVLIDRQGSLGWLRYGSGDWRTGWHVSMIGDLIVRNRGQLLAVPSKGGAWRFREDGSRERIPLRERPFRMTASNDGQVFGFGYIVPDTNRLSRDDRQAIRAAVSTSLLSVRDAKTFAERWSVKPLEQATGIDELPQPAKDFPELAESFNMKPDAVIPFQVAASVALGQDGSTVAIAQYGGWLWLRRGPAIGRWDPPYHVIPFVPRQRGVLRILGTDGRELSRSTFPEPGLFEVHLNSQADAVWCVPMSWFSRGLAGCPWRPTDDGTTTVSVYDVARKAWTQTWRFPDAVSDLALHPDGQLVLVSCWDGWLYLMNRHGVLHAKLRADSPARLRWSGDGRFAVAGCRSGEVLCVDANGELRWRLKLPATEHKPHERPLKPVIEGLPIYSVGRVGPEHAYVGDMWLIKTREGGILVDAGGTSSIPSTWERMKAAGIDRQQVKYLLHTHSHGDHCGAGYLWRSMGLKVVAPETAAFAMGWLMPMLTDYGVWVPRKIDLPLPLKRVGDEAELSLCGLRIIAIFAPGHSVDSVVYALQLNGKRVVFTGDIGFRGTNNILHRCWGDVDKAKAVTEVIRRKVLSLRPDHVFTGHGVQRDGTQFLQELIGATLEAIGKAEQQ